MSATRAVGATRTYARLQPGEPFQFGAWAKAIRAGRTFVTTGPALFLKVDGHEPGDEIDIQGGRQFDVEAVAESVFPVHQIEIVQDGQIVSSGTSPLKTKIAADKPGWIAARCSSERSAIVWHANDRRAYFAGL